MKYLLDANIIILALTGRGEQLLHCMAQCDEGDMVTSAIALGEVALGTANGKPPSPDQLRAFVREVPVLAFDHRAAMAYSTLPFKCASFDQLIAAHALSQSLTVVTDNVAHFDAIPGLQVENWTR